MPKVINVRQLAIMFFISTIALRMTILPSMIHKDIGKESFLLMSLYAFIELISFFLIYYLLKKNQNISFYQFLKKHLGDIGAKVVFFIIFVFYFFKMLILLRGGFVYARDVAFQEATFSLYAFIILMISGSLYFFKLRALSRTMEIFFPLIFIFLIISLIIPFLTTMIYDIRPLLDIPTPTFFNTVLRYLIFSGNFVFALLFMGKIKFNNNKSDFRILFNIVLMALIILASFYFVFNSVFKYTGYTHRNAVSDIVQFVPTPSILGNFEIITVSLIKLVFVLYGPLFTFVLCECVEESIRIKNINKVKNRKWILVFVFALILFFCYFLFKTSDSLILFVKEYMSYFTIIVFITLLFLFLIGIFKKKDRKNEKNI